MGTTAAPLSPYDDTTSSKDWKPPSDLIEETLKAIILAAQMVIESNQSHSQNSVARQSANAFEDSMETSKIGETVEVTANTRRDTWPRSKFDKIPKQGRPEAAAKHTIQTDEKSVAKVKTNKMASSGALAITSIGLQVSK